jgi:hypothetical protein
MSGLFSPLIFWWLWDSFRRECVNLSATALQAAVSLYQAVGGGWSPTTREVEIARANESYEANKGPWP